MLCIVGFDQVCGNRASQIISERGTKKRIGGLTVSQLVSTSVEVADNRFGVLTLPYLLVVPSDVVASIEEEGSVSIECDQRSF